MLENLKRVREPLAWILVVVAAVQFALGAVVPLVGLAVARGSLNQADIGISLLGVAARSVDYPLALVLAGVVVTCLLAPATRHALGLASTAAWLLSVAVVVAFASLVFSLLQLVPIGGIDLYTVLSALAALAASIVATVAVWAVVRSLDVEPDEDEPAALPAADWSPDSAVEAEPEPSRPAPVWGRSQAAGTVWRTADEAASGVPGASSLAGELPGEADADEQDQRPPGGAPSAAG